MSEAQWTGLALLIGGILAVLSPATFATGSPRGETWGPGVFFVLGIIGCIVGGAMLLFGGENKKP